MNYPKVSIIILNWNRWQDTIECLESVYNISYPNYEVIVVDNGSKDGSVQKINDWAEGKIQAEQTFFYFSSAEFNTIKKPITCVEIDENGIFNNETPNIKYNHDSQTLYIIKNPKNYGFAEGNNIGCRWVLAKKQSEYILLLNNDTVVKKDFIGHLINTTENNPKIGIAGSVNYYYGEPDEIWYTGAMFNQITGKAHFVDRKTMSGLEKTNIRAYLSDLAIKIINDNKLSNISDEVINVDEVAGSALLIKADLIKKIGFLDKNFFCYYEDSDWCAKAKTQNMLVCMSLKSKIWHKVSKTANKIDGFNLYFMTRNRTAFMKRHAKPIHFILFIAYILSIDSIITLIRLTYRLKFKLIPIFYKGIIDGLNFKPIDKTKYAKRFLSDSAFQ